MRSFESRTLVNAPVERIWALLTDAPAFPSWNTTVERIEGQIALGQKLKIFAKLNPGRGFPVRVTTLTPNERMVWTGGMPLGLFKGERTFTLTRRADGVEFHMCEVFSGPMAPLIGRAIPDMQPAFEAFAADLKRRAETAS